MYEGLDKELYTLKNNISEYELRISNTYKGLKECDKPSSVILIDSELNKLFND